MAQTAPPGSGIDGAAKEPAQIVGLAAGRILRHVRDRETLLHRKRDRLHRLLLDEGEVPLLRVLPDRRAADERVDLQRNTGLLLQLGGGHDVGDDGPAGDVEPDLQPRVALLLREPLHRGALVGAGVVEAEVELRHAELVEQVEDLDLRLDGRIDRGRALDAVAEGLIQDFRFRELTQIRGAVPVVEEILLAHADESYASSRSSAIPCPTPMQADPRPRRWAPRRISYNRGAAIPAPD